MHDLCRRMGKSPPPSDDKMFSVPESILKHPFAIPPEEFLEHLINPHTRKLDHGYGNLKTMFEDEETHKPVPYIPPDRERKKAWFKEGH